jgi:hypothetical protein
MEARAEARFNRAMKSGRTGWAMKTARFYELVSGKIATFGLSDISTYR